MMLFLDARLVAYYPTLPNFQILAQSTILLKYYWLWRSFRVPWEVGGHKPPYVGEHKTKGGCGGAFCGNNNNNNNSSGSSSSSSSRWSAWEVLVGVHDPFKAMEY